MQVRVAEPPFLLVASWLIVLSFSDSVRGGVKNTSMFSPKSLLFFLCPCCAATIVSESWGFSSRNEAGADVNLASGRASSSNVLLNC
jgi:hypothetical protein